MIAPEIMTALDQCRDAGLEVKETTGMPLVVCPDCEEDWRVSVASPAAHRQARWLRQFAADHRGHPAAPVARHEFTVLVDPVPTDEQVTHIYTRHPDIGIGSSPRNGVGYLRVDRRAEYLAEAIISVVRDIEQGGLRPIRVDHDDPEAEATVDAANLALLLRALAPRVPQMQVIQRLAAP